MRSAVCRQVHGTPAPQTPQGCRLLRRSPPGIGKIPVDSDGFGCWAEGTQAWSLPVPELPLGLVACTGHPLQAYGNIWRGERKEHMVWQLKLLCNLRILELLYSKLGVGDISNILHACSTWDIVNDFIIPPTHKQKEPHIYVSFFLLLLSRPPPVVQL